MSISDTNVISELVREEPNPGVVAYIERKDISTYYLTSTIKAELLLGVNVLPAGKRKSILLDSYQQMFNHTFRGRILPFDEASAESYAKLMAERKSSGRPLSLTDGQIAAVAYQNNLPVTTRNEKDFEGLGIVVENPWTD